MLKKFMNFWENGGWFPIITATFLLGVHYFNKIASKELEKTKHFQSLLEQSPSAVVDISERNPYDYFLGFPEPRNSYFWVSEMRRRNPSNYILWISGTEIHSSHNILIVPAYNMETIFDTLLKRNSSENISPNMLKYCEPFTSNPLINPRYGYNNQNLGHSLDSLVKLIQENNLIKK